MKHWKLLLVALTLAGTMGAGLLRYHARPRQRCGLPKHDYQHVSRSRPELALSQRAVLIQRSALQAGVPAQGTDAHAPALTRYRLKFYQLDQPSLAINQCSISRVALVLHENGAWTLSLQADQNPRSPEDGGATESVQDPTTGAIKQTAQIKRNHFYVKIRCYGAYQVDEADTKTAPGKPVLFQLEPAPFWVQNGVPYNFWTRQSDRDVQQYFDLIDRVEIEFYYR